MKKKIVKNILITCASGSASIYLARKMKNKFNIFLADATSLTVAPRIGFPFQKLPFGNNPLYIKKVKALVKKWQIDCIVPGADEELLPINSLCRDNPSVLAVMPSSSDFIATCLNKKKLMQTLGKFGILHPPPFQKKSAIKYPVVAKPIYGRGSREVHKIENNRQLEGYLRLYGRNFNEILIQPYIGGEEYTISVIVNNFNKIIGIVPKRVILKKGITMVAVTENNTLIEKTCKRIVEKLKPAGHFNVQLKVYKNNVYIFEINPRLSTTTVLTDRAFGNEVELYIKYYNKETIMNYPKMRGGVYLYRYEENLFK